MVVPMAVYLALNMGTGAGVTAAGWCGSGSEPTVPNTFLAQAHRVAMQPVGSALGAHLLQLPLRVSRQRAACCLSPSHDEFISSGTPVSPPVVLVVRP